MTINNRISLHGLTNPELFNDPIQIPKQDSEQYYNMLQLMQKIRSVEDIISLNVENGNIICPCHLSNGQEAIPVSISNNLNNFHYIFGNHRSHGHYLACGGSAYELFAEVLGKATGCSKGMGGSMHIASPQNGFIGSVPIVAGTIPIAVGAALAAKYKDNRSIAVAYFGDGATEEGVFHEALNLAANLALPILFVCENNLFSSHLHISERQPLNATARFAEANGIESYIEDGNDIVCLNNLLKKVIPSIREKKKPIYIEAVTYRQKGHVGHDENIDVGLNRSVDLKMWEKRDPIERTLKGLMEINMQYQKRFEDWIIVLENNLNQKWQKALIDPYPKPSQTKNTVYYN